MQMNMELPWKKSIGVLRESLLGKAARRKSFKDALLAMTNAGNGEGFRNAGVTVINPFSKSKLKGELNR